MSALVAALQRGVGTPGPTLSATSIAAAPTGSVSESPVDTVTIAGSTESAAHISGSIVTNPTRRSLVDAGDAVLAAFHILGPLLALAGVAGPLLVATSSAAARTSSSRAEPTSVADAIVAARLVAPSNSTRVPSTNRSCSASPSRTAPARGPPGGGAPAITSEILVPLSPASPSGSPEPRAPSS